MLIVLVILVAVLVVLIVVMCRVLFPESRPPYYRADVEVQSGIEVVTGRLETRKDHIERQSGPERTILVDGGPAWQLDLQSSTGETRSKRFHNRVILGRAQPAPEPPYLLYLDDDSRVSRQQCEIFAVGNNLAVRNCSTSHMTMVDGRSAENPILIHPGSVIKTGGADWRVTVARLLCRP